MYYEFIFEPRDPELRQLAYTMVDVQLGRVSPSEGEAMARAYVRDTDLAQEPEANDPHWADLAREHVARLRDLIAYVRDEEPYGDEQKEALVALIRAEIALTLTHGSDLWVHDEALRAARRGVIGGTVSLAQARAIALLARAAVEVARDPARPF